MILASIENVVMHLHPNYEIVWDEVIDQSHGECYNKEKLLHLQDLKIE